MRIGTLCSRREASEFSVPSSPVDGWPIRVSETILAAIPARVAPSPSDSAGSVTPALAGASPPILELGGETIVVRTYAELMTSIINPNHDISERYREQLLLDAVVPLQTPMPMPHIDTMTVRQLVDIVTFLDSRYSLVEGYESGF